jgi:hypothetical protein
MIDIRATLENRAENVTSKNPDLSTQYTVYKDDRNEWGILHIFDQEDKVIGVEFFETEDSWRRPGSVRDYNIAADEGYPVAVVLPDTSFKEFRQLAVERGKEGFSTYLYSDLKIKPVIKA